MWQSVLCVCAIDGQSENGMRIWHGGQVTVVDWRVCLLSQSGDSHLKSVVLICSGIPCYCPPPPLLLLWHLHLNQVERGGVTTMKYSCLANGRERASLFYPSVQPSVLGMPNAWRSLAASAVDMSTLSKHIVCRGCSVYSAERCHSSEKQTACALLMLALI